MLSKKFHFPMTIESQYIDSFGHVNNAAYLTIMELARWDLLIKNDYGLDKIKATMLGPTILEIKIVFMKELKLGDQINIETQLVSYQKKVGTLVQTITRDGEICSSADFVIGLFDIKHRRLVEPTSEWLAAIGAN